MFFGYFCVVKAKDKITNNYETVFFRRSRKIQV